MNNQDLLIARIEDALDNDVPEMIGVFGPDSDRIVLKSLEQVTIPFHNMGYYDVSRADAFLVIASSAFNFMNGIISREIHSCEYSAVTEAQKCKLLELISKLSPYFDHDGVRSFTYLNDEMQKGEICRRLFCELKAMAGFSEKTKFVLQIDVGLNDINFNLFQNLKRIQPPDLLIIVNFVADADVVSCILNRCVGIQSEERIILNKFFPIGNIIE